MSDQCFYHESLRTWIKTIVNKFAISNHTALIPGVHALRRYLKLICEYELHSLPYKKVSGAKDHGKSYIKVRPPLVRHLLRNRLLISIATVSLQSWLDRNTSIEILRMTGEVKPQRLKQTNKYSLLLQTTEYL